MKAMSIILHVLRHAMDEEKIGFRKWRLSLLLTGGLFINVLTNVIVS
jgi:hypothetical protein